MITFLTVLGVVLGIPLGYVLIGILYGRSCSLAIYQKYYRQHRSRFKALSDEDGHRYAEELTRSDMGLKVVFWPIEMIADLFRKASTGNPVMGPVYAHRYQVEQLRKDAKYWTRVAAEEIDDEKKAMAEELARVLGEQAERADKA